MSDEDDTKKQANVIKKLDASRYAPKEPRAGFASPVCPEQKLKKRKKVKEVKKKKRISQRKVKKKDKAEKNTTG